MIKQVFFKYRLLFAIFFSGALLVALLVVWQNDQRYLYDVSFLHANLLYFVAAAFSVSSVVGIIIRKSSVKKGTLVANLVAIALLVIFMIVDMIFVVWPSSSKTDDIKNYKKFDVQVQDSVYEFFPDMKENYEVIKYDYYYSFPYHHVYSIYLELKVDGDISELVNSYRVGKYTEQVFPHDEKYIEITYDDEIDYDHKEERVYNGKIKKVLYSKKDKIVIFQCFESWSFCDLKDVYYFERFNINPIEYTKNKS